VSVLALPGADLVYDISGTGPVVVLIHGFGLDMRMWEPQVEGLAGSFQLLRYDCRGFGSSGPLDPGVPYTHAGDLIALLDHLGIDEAVLIGLSFGGRVALQCTLLAPTRVQALVLLDAVLDGVPWDADSSAALDELAGEVEAGGVAAGRRAWLAHPLFGSARKDPGLSSSLATMVGDYPGQHWLGDDPHLAEPPPIDALNGVTVPTLVVVGDRDVPCFIEMARVLSTSIPGAQQRIVRGAGHMVNMEQPTEVNGLITEFLNGSRAETTSPSPAESSAGRLNPLPRAGAERSGRRAP
jgi:3-oxoadipate enol-lactonase